MDKDERALSMRPPETEFFLQWGNRKRLRCVRIRNSSSSPPYFSSSLSPSPDHPSSTTRIRRKITSRFISAPNQEKQLTFPQPRLTRNSEIAVRSENRRGSPEKEERSYTTRGSVSVVGNAEENGKVNHHPVDTAAGNHQGGDENMNNNSRGGSLVWPKLYISLSSKEKEEDFLAMKGCKLPQRPKKRAKLIQRTLLLVSPGAWLTDMSLERYEVREKKTAKKKPRGLKAMGSIESDSD